MNVTIEQRGAPSGYFWTVRLTESRLLRKTERISMKHLLDAAQVHGTERPPAVYFRPDRTGPVWSWFGMASTYCRGWTARSLAVEGRQDASSPGGQLTSTRPRFPEPAN